MAVSSTIDNGDTRVLTVTGSTSSVTLQPAIGVELIRVVNSTAGSVTVRVMPGKKLNGTKNGTVSVPASESRAFKGNRGGWTMLENSASLDSSFLQVANNLSDVTAATARSNLGLGAAATKSMAQVAADAALTATYVRKVTLGTVAADNLAALQAAATSLGATGGCIRVEDPGQYPISDSFSWDAEDMHLHLEAGVHIYTTAATTSGHAIAFVGYPAAGTATTPQRNSAKVTGAGKITGWTSGANENALGAVRVKKFIVEPGLELNSGNKALTCQYGVSDVVAHGVNIPVSTYRGVSIEQLGASRVSLRDITVGTTGAEAVLVSGDTVTLDGIYVASAFATASPGSNAAVRVYAGATPMVRCTVRDVRVVEANGAKGVKITGASGIAKAENVYVDHSTGAGLEYNDCTGLTIAENVVAPLSSTTVSQTGTTTNVILRNTNAIEAAALSVGEPTISRFSINSTSLSMTSGTLRLAYFVATKSEPITSLRVLCGGTAAGATPTLIRLVVCSVADTGDLTIITSTASDTSLLASTNTAYTKALQATWTKVAGNRYALGLLVVTGAAVPTVAGNSIVGGINSEAGQSPKTGAAITGLTDLPSSPISAGSATSSIITPYIVAVP